MTSLSDQSATAEMVERGAIALWLTYKRERVSAQRRPGRDRCGACGRFLPKDSFYTNRCSDCWGPEDEFI